MVAGYDLRAPWLLIAYAPVPRDHPVRRTGDACRSSRALGETIRDGREIEADILGSRLPRIFAIDAVIYALVIADMVLKPLS